ncbi:uncharacterized protein LOC125649228 isoform X2 [Ostrea edulis]|uniref:uncharacterized protein LOC125649228 isoform X2 n=1 Tax=Ostrea edulis TaxID=37623 RepID=UPI0024AFEDFE|nr:uncharacterized protein LOC125649228 isoform X2 [Ostrea edulis]
MSKIAISEMKIIYFISLLCLSCDAVPLPRWIHRVSSCPEANNITAWKAASEKLNCLYDLTSDDPAQQKMVYHCLASTYLNETVEFCGRSVPIAPGNCPIYNYQFFENKVASYYNCSKFMSGCPNHMTHSKNVFKYPECFNIDSERSCFRSEDRCSMTNLTENITVSTTALNTTDELSTERSITNDVSQNRTRSESGISYVVRESNGNPVLMVISGILGGVLLTVIPIFLFISLKLNLLTYLKKQLMYRRQCEEKQHVDETECISMLETQSAENNPEKNPAYVEVLGASESTLGSDSGVETGDNGGQKYRTEKRPETHINMENEEKKAGKSIKNLEAIVKLSDNKEFNAFLRDVSKDMTPGTLEEMKTLLKDRIEGLEDDLGDISTAFGLLEYMDRKLSLYNNLAILQAYSLAIAPPDETLYEKCLNYGKKARDIFYFQRCTKNLKGFQKVEYHIQCENINAYNKGDLDILHKSLAKVLGVKPDDMLLVGIRKGSIILTFMIRSAFIPNLRTILLDRKSLKNITYRVMLFRRLTHRVFKVTINGEVVYEPGKRTEEVTVPTVIKEAHLKRAEVEKYQQVTDEKGDTETKIEILKNNDEDGVIVEFLDKLGGSITDDILTSMKMALKDFIDENTLRKLDTSSLLRHLQANFKIEYNLYFLQWIFEKCSAHQLSEECFEFASKHRFPLLYFQSKPLSGKSTEEQCIKFYIENDLERCQDEVYDLREWIAKYLRIDIGQIMIAGLEKGSVTVVFRVLLGNAETDLMALASTDEFQAGVSRKGVKKIFVGSEKCITVGKAQTFVHIHCSGLHEGNTVDNVKKMVSTVRQKARELVIDGSKVFLRIKDKQKRKEPEIGKKRTGTKERQRLLEELEPTQILRNSEVQKVIEGQGINKTLAQSREEKCNIVIDVVDQLPDVTRDVILNSVGEHEESCDETNYTKTSSNKNPVTLPDFETVSEEIDSSIIDETFEKIRYVPSHIKQKCSSASGRNRKERANTFLNYIQENANRRQIFMMVWQKHVE